MPETLAKTTARSFTKGSLVNLERSLRFGSRIEGHFVQGHVEARGRVTGIAVRGGSREMSIALPRPLMRFVAPKGSITLDGVSLTVARKGVRSIVVAIIPHTLRATTLGTLAEGDRVNVETDMMARQLAALR
jgi:riboflavin synthase